MKLDQRLRLLREQTAPSVVEDSSAIESAPTAPLTRSEHRGPALSERLRRFSVSTRRTAPRKECDEPALAAVLGAERLSPGVLRLERRIPGGRRQGRYIPADCIRALPTLMDVPPGKPEEWLFLDTETSGLAGGTGTWAFLIGLARLDRGDLLLRQYLLTRLDAEQDYLAVVMTELEPSALLITYNGKSFDGPLLTTRLRLSGIRCALLTGPHLDLLHSMRRAFSRVWPDCRLATAERRLLGLRRRGDLPGSEAPRAWLAWLRRGEIAPLAAVIEHNRQDLLSLPALIPALARSLRRPESVGADAGSVAAHWLARGEEATAYSILRERSDLLSDAGLLALARLHRRRGEWAEAHRIWRTMSGRGHADATEELVKHLEHRERDYGRALTLIDRLPAGPAREHRRRRLESKLRKGGGRRVFLGCL